MKLSFRQKQLGMSLIEVLVSLAILAGGLVGAVALQMTAKKSSFDAQQRSLASSLAQDIIERMRVSDSTLLESYEGTYGDGSLSTPANRCNSAANPCTPANLITNDLFEWEQKLMGASITHDDRSIGGLVDPAGCIVHTDNMVSVIISWEGRMATTDGVKSDISGANSCGDAGSTRRQLAMEVYIF